MQFRQFLLKKSSPRNLSWSITLVLLSGLLSCNNERQTTLQKEEPTPVKLTYSQVKKAWPENVIKDISYLSFYTLYDRIKGDYDVRLQAYDVNHNPVGKSKLASKRNNKPVIFPQIGIEDNLINLTDLNIIDGNGKLVKFDSIRLSQAVYIDSKSGSNEKYLQYSVEVFVDGKTIKDIAYTLPCPPCYNCRPVPGDCSVKADTTSNPAAPVTDSSKEP